MARPLRVEYPGAYYHVMNRGNAGEKIFVGGGDKEKFLEYLEKAAEQFSIVIHSYCLMGNYYHLLIETPEPNLSVAIQWLNVSYATFFNKRHHRYGHLFQGRFKAILVDVDEYLMQLSRYIHLNPVCAKIVDHPIDYPWSSYPAFMGAVEKPLWLNTGWLLTVFGKRRRDAIRNYRNFVEDVDAMQLENPSEKAIGGFILGGDTFVQWVKSKYIAARSDHKEVPQLKLLKPKPTVAMIIQAVCSEFECSEKQVIEKGRKGNDGRDVTIYLSRKYSGMSFKALGDIFGGVSGEAIAMRQKKVENELCKDKKMMRKIDRVRKRIINI